MAQGATVTDSWTLAVSPSARSAVTSTSGSGGHSLTTSITNVMSPAWSQQLGWIPLAIRVRRLLLMTPVPSTFGK